ncbi:unnamed protein product [Acanthoscelides obtectus]|uniref:Ig-like domain-containing protein n=1 Tax=Acanthoscelides obtectus TaxID=200917 RepID=A0A9P0P107_ACAOB|nr:unnamed protein product [Acanthoscelides obtectus]CAK1639474.1 hypothetical protein AOBTE_LOCUS11199 [Acanthoscelides obtectus]
MDVNGGFEFLVNSLIWCYDMRLPLQTVRHADHTNKAKKYTHEWINEAAWRRKFFSTSVPNTISMSFGQNLFLLCTHSTIFISPVTPQEIKTLMTNSSNKHSSGFDDLSLDTLGTVKSLIVDHLAFLFTKSIELGCYPDVIKLAIVVPMLKKEDSKKPENYRQISQIGSIAKYLGKLCGSDKTKHCDSDERVRSTDMLQLVRANGKIKKHCLLRAWVENGHWEAICPCLLHLKHFWLSNDRKMRYNVTFLLLLKNKKKEVTEIVSWIRHRDLHLLTVGRFTYTSDQRFVSIHNPMTEDWTLQIRYPQRRDSGVYECQVGITPPIGNTMTLSVVGLKMGGTNLRLGVVCFEGILLAVLPQYEHQALINIQLLPDIFREPSSLDHQRVVVVPAEYWQNFYRRVGVHRELNSVNVTAAETPAATFCLITTRINVVVIEPRIHLRFIILNSAFGEPVTTLLGGPEMYINKGSTMNLTCIVKHSPEPPPSIYWTHNGQAFSCSLSHYKCILVSKTGKGSCGTEKCLVALQRYLRKVVNVPGPEVTLQSTTTDESLSKIKEKPTENIWKKCAEEFENRWGFPNFIGSVDGKHVTIKRPNNSGSNYWCYLHKYSIVLMAIVGPDYKFICVDIGGFGKNSDGGIFETSNMGKRFEQNLMSVPAPRFLPGQNEICSYVLIGDEAFALKPYLMRPFPYKQTLTDVRKEKYNQLDVLIAADQRWITSAGPGFLADLTTETMSKKSSTKTEDSSISHSIRLVAQRDCEYGGIHRFYRWMVTPHQQWRIVHIGAMLLSFRSVESIRVNVVYRKEYSRASSITSAKRERDEELST